MKNFDKQAYLDEVRQYLDSNNIQYTDVVAEKTFYAHMGSLIDRLMNDEVIVMEADQYSAVLDELEEVSLNISKEIGEPLFKLFKQEISTMELILIATHIQTNINSKGERK